MANEYCGAQHDCNVGYELSKNCIVAMFWISSDTKRQMQSCVLSLISEMLQVTVQSKCCVLVGSTVTWKNIILSLQMPLFSSKWTFLAVHINKEQ